MSVGGEALIYRPLECTDKGPMYSHIVSVQNSGKEFRNGGKKYSKPMRSMSTCVPSSSYEALRYAVAALNRLDDFNCEKIGAGFFSEVFKVTHRTTGQVMVLKMNTSLSNRANMLREVQLMNRLSHENILRFMGVCVHEGQLHALTEYINGGSLEQLLQSKHIELSWETRIKLSLDIARGMCYLHSRGVFHRDLTSKNVLIKINTDEMTAVVGDFGLAEKIPDPRDRSHRLPIVGSPYWMAPECLKGAWYNNKADIFSYGIVLCEIIARIEADPDILPRTENFGVDYVAFSDMCPDCPPQYLELAFTSCKIDPDSRPNFKEIVHQLEKMLNVISSMSGGSNLFYPPVVYTSCWDDGDNIDSVRAIFAHGWNKLNTSNNKISPTKYATPMKVPNSVPQTPVTPKHIGEAMSMWDPHYKPYNSSFNPFASLPRFWKGKKFLEPSISENDLSHSMNFGLTSPEESKSKIPVPDLHPQSPSNSPGRNISKSLPSSPVLQRKLPNLQTLYNNMCTDDISDSPRSVSPGQFSPPSSMSPFEPEDQFSEYNSVEEQMSDCKLDDDLANKIAEESPPVVTFRAKTPSLCAKLRRSSGESGFFSVGDRNSTCDLSLEGYQGQEDLSSWAMEGNVEPPIVDGNVEIQTMEGNAEIQTMESNVDLQAMEGNVNLQLHDSNIHVGGRKRPSSCYSDDSCCCCGHHSPNLYENLGANKEHFDKSDSKDSFSNSLASQSKSAARATHECHLCSSEVPCRGSALGEVSSHVGGVHSVLKASAFDTPMDRHSIPVMSKMCEKGKRIAKCMRTSDD